MPPLVMSGGFFIYLIDKRHIIRYIINIIGGHYEEDNNKTQRY